MDILTTSEVNTVLYTCMVFWVIEQLLKLAESIAEWVVDFLRSLPDKKRSSRSSSEERDDSSELPEDK